MFNGNEFIEANHEMADDPFCSPVLSPFFLGGNNSYLDVFNSLFEKEFQQKEISLDEEKEEESQDNFNIRKMNSIQNNEDFYSKRIIEKKEKSQKELSGSTNPSSEKKIERIKPIGGKFQTAKLCQKNWRFDMAKKHWKTYISKVARKQINKLIKESDLPQSLKMKIHAPNSKLFTANVNVKDNFDFLFKNLREIFTIGKEEGLQKQNNEFITNIYNHFEKIGDNNLSERIRKVKNFFEMKYEELIRKFYESDEFHEFKEQKDTKFYDEGTFKQEGFSLTEDYGLIKLFKMVNKKRTRD